MPKQLTVRGVADEVARRLEAMGREQNKSVNSIVLSILERAVDASERRRRLRRYATWDPEELAEFEETLREQRRIDEALWR